MPIEPSVFYTDIGKTIVDGDFPVLENEDSVKESVINLLQLFPGEDFYDGIERGVNLDQYLFEIIDLETAMDIYDTIIEGISTQEPRALDLNVTVEPLPDENTYEIIINYTTDFSQEPETIEIKLNELR